MEKAVKGLLKRAERDSRSSQGPTSGLMDETVLSVMERLKKLRNPIWYPNYLVIKPLWEDLQRTVQYAHGRFLDLGCGHTPYRQWFEPKVSEYVAADLPPVSKEASVACDCQQLPFHSDCFDAVLITQVLEHAPKPWHVADELFRVIKPGGVLILSCPQYWPLHEKPNDYFRFTPYGLQSLFDPKRWEWLEHRQQGSSWAVIGTAIWLSFPNSGKLRRIFCLIFNPLLSLLDRFLRNENDTTNHLIVARKRYRRTSRETSC